MRTLFKTAAVALGVMLAAGGVLAASTAANADPAYGYGYGYARHERHFEHEYRRAELRRWEAPRRHRTEYRDYRGYHDYRDYRHGDRYGHHYGYGHR